MAIPASKTAVSAISRNPATGVLIETYPFQTADEIEHMPVANKAAAEQWRATSLASRAALYPSDAYEASGFPKDLFASLNTGNGAVVTVIEDRRIAAVTVTGSMRAGSAVAATAGKAMKKSLLELGGADAYIVLADAEIDNAVAVGIEARFRNAGQVCLAAKRFILKRPISNEFTRKYVQAAR